MIYYDSITRFFYKSVIKDATMASPGTENMPCLYTQTGSANFSSGHTQQLQRQAVLCDQSAILARLRQTGENACCVVRPTNSTNATPASVYIQNLQNTCTLTPAEELGFPKNGISEGERIKRLQQKYVDEAQNQFDASTRFVGYQRFVPQAPCAPPTAEQLNSTQPNAPLIGCQPSRFF